MEIAIKAGQYPDHQLEINKLEQWIKGAKETEERNKKNQGFNVRHEFVLNYERLQDEVDTLKAVAERKELKPEDLY